jgi:hypothetical protein
MMRRVLGAYLVVSALALVACAGTARAQAPAPTPAPAVVPWDEAELTWTPPAEFLTGGSLAGCEAGPCGVLYIVEMAASPGPGWGPLAITSETHYRATDLPAGVWQFRVRAFIRGGGYSPAGPVVNKTIKAPTLTAPVTTTVQ